MKYSPLLLSKLRKIDPLSHTWLLLALLIYVFTTQDLWLLFYLLLLSLLGLALFGGLHKMKNSLLLIGLFVISLFMVQGLFYPHNKIVFWQFGGLIFYQAGILYAAKLSLHLLLLVALIFLYTTITPLEETLNFLQLKGLSRKQAYLLGAVFNILPSMLKNWQKIKRAQQARGLDLQGNILLRLKALLPSLLPLIITTLYAASQRTIALELKGINESLKQPLMPNKKYFYPQIIQPLAILSLLIIIFRGVLPK